MPKYASAESYEADVTYERNYYLEKIANELAESNRLKRIELRFTASGRMKEEDLEDEA